MMKFLLVLITGFCFLSLSKVTAQTSRIKFNDNWEFYLGDDSAARKQTNNDTKWRILDLPHDWSIEGNFSEKHPTTFNQGALPAGIGWYRKSFTVPVSSKDKKTWIIFDGVYRNSEVWINGHYLGKRPNGYIGFRYDLSSYLNYGFKKNLIAVKVDNSLQPNSRWYTGSGIYRNVWLQTKPKIAINDQSVFIHTSEVTNNGANVYVDFSIDNQTNTSQLTQFSFEVFDPKGMKVSSGTGNQKKINAGVNPNTTISIKINNLKLWSVDAPQLYKMVIRIKQDGKILDQFESGFGIRYFNFDAQTGFSLNGKPLKILGVCNHHDLGALGAAVNARAIERQLQILKNMGCNAIRTAHNPPAPELLDLCDRMGFLVMDEAFDIWKKRKNRYDYNIDFDQWHRKDLEDMIIRDRNHPSVFVWCIGNEIREQFDSSGLSLTREMVNLVKNLDTTRPVICALTENIPEKNFIYRSGALDILGFNYKLDDYDELPARFPGEKFIATETASALETRSYYEMPSDSNRKWPPDSKPWKGGNPDHTVSAYDHVFAYWGASHEDSWKAVKKYDYIAGCFVWSGFDFLGEPVPYSWPSRSSYYGIIDLAGFPKDVYYMYQSEWTKKPVLHIFPHWNWNQGQEVDVWAYYSQADEVELFLNGRSLGIKKKQGDSVHVSWRVPYEKGSLKAISRLNGKEVLTSLIKTAGEPYAIRLFADRTKLKADGVDLSFITAKLFDREGNLVPDADQLISFSITGPATINGVDNGDPVSHEPFKTQQCKAFHGLCLAIIQAGKKAGKIILTASSPKLISSSIELRSE